MKPRRHKSQTNKHSKIEKKVFTRWINFKLKSSDKSVVDIENDLSDGKTLIKLVETLSGKKITEITKVNLRRDRINYVDLALSVLKRDGVEITDIDSSDISDGHLSTIMELVWQLIIHYSIKRFLYTDKNRIKFTPDEFLNWLNSKMNGLIISNFSSDWTNGVVMGILVNTCDRDLCVDVHKWDSKKNIKNLQFAMEAAEMCFGVQLLLEPREIVEAGVTERSLITYISQFVERLMYHVSPKTDDTDKEGKSMREDGDNTSMMLVALPVDHRMIERNTGCNVIIKEEGNLYIHDYIHFLVTLPDGTDVSDIDIVMEARTPDGSIVPISMNQTNEESVMEFSFVSALPGIYEITIRRQHTAIESVLLKTFSITLMSLKNEANMFVYGPGLFKAVVGHSGIFILETNQTDKKIGFSMEGPSKVDIDCVDLGNGTIKIVYMTMTTGVYEMSITGNDMPVCNSPYLISVVRPPRVFDYSNIRVTGLFHENMSSFTIDARLIDLNILPDITCFDELGSILTNVSVKEQEPQVYNCHLIVSRSGRYIIFAGFSGVQIPGFPHVVCFTTMLQSTHKDSSNEDQDIISIQRKCLDILQDNIVDSIEISVRVLCEETHVDSVLYLGASFTSNVISAVDVSMKILEHSYKWQDERFGMYLFGSSLNGHPIKCCQKQSIIINVDSAKCIGEMAISIEGPSNTNVQCSDNDNGRCVIEYCPNKPGQYVFNVLLKGEHIDGSPFLILVSEDSASLCHPPSLRDETDASTKEPCILSSLMTKLEKSSYKLKDLSSSIICQDNIYDANTDFPTQLLHTREPYLSKTQHNSFNPSFHFDDSDECMSDGSSISSADSLHSILSGVYTAKIRRAIHNEISIMSDNLRVLDEETGICSVGSSNIMLEKISVNYRESLNRFYDNMISAFTNLQVSDMFLASVDSICDTIMSEVDHRTVYIPQKSIESAESVASTDSTTIQETLEVNTPSIGIDTVFVYICPHSEDSLSPSTIVVSDSFHSIEECIKRVAYHSQCVESNSSFVRLDHLSGCTTDDNQMTLTLLGCRKSIRVDLESSSVSYQNRVGKDRTIKASAEVIFDSLSQTLSRKTSKLSSVYQSPFDRHYSEPLLDKSSDEIDLTTSSLVMKEDNVEDTTSEDLISCFHSHFKRTSRCVVCCGNRSDNSWYISCHKNIRPRLRSNKDNRLKRHLLRMKRLRVNNSCESSLHYRTKVMHTCFNSDLYLKEEYNKYYSQENMHSMTFVKLDDEEALSLINADYNEFQIISCIVATPELNIAQILSVNSSDQQLRCKHHLQLNNKDSQTNLSSIENINTGEIILLDSSKGSVFPIALDMLLDCHRENNNKFKELAEVKVLDREVQTCLYKDMSTTDVSSTTLNKVENNQNNEPCKDSQLECHSHLVKYCPLNDKQINSFCESHTPDIKDISSAVETLVDAITDIAKSHIMHHPSKSNIRRMEELIGLLPKLITFGKEKKLYQINYLTDKLESILLRTSNRAGDDNSLTQIIRLIKRCLYMDTDRSKMNNSVDQYQIKKMNGFEEANILKEIVNVDNVFSSNIAEVRAVGQALEYGRTHYDNKFVVYTTCNMIGSLSISLEGPSKAIINFMDRKIGIFVVCYHVTVPGDYTCSITYNLIEIENSPFKIKVSSNCLVKKIEKSKTDSKKVQSQMNNGAHSILLPVGRNVIFHIHNSSVTTLSSFITGPSGICGYLPIEILDNEGLIRMFTSHPGIYNLEFFNSFGDRVGESWTLNVINMRNSLHSNIVHYNVDIDNCTIESSNNIVPNIVAYGEGLSLGRTLSKNVFHIVIRHKYNDVLTKDPSLNVTIDGPSKVELSCTDNNVGYTFWYIASISGIYYISITYSAKHNIAGSPFKVNIV